MQNLYSTKEDLLTRADKEKLLAQKEYAFGLLAYRGQEKPPLPIMQVEYYMKKEFTLRYLMVIT